MSEAEKTWLESLKDTVKESLANAPAQIAQELVHKGNQGAHEFAAALFNGSAFVMYPRAQQGVEQSLEEALKQEPVQQQEQPALERGGRGH